MGNQIIQSKIQKSRYFRRYKDFFNMYRKIFIKHKMKIIRNLITHAMTFFVVNIKMTLAEQVMTPYIILSHFTSNFTNLPLVKP